MVRFEEAAQYVDPGELVQRYNQRRDTLRHGKGMRRQAAAKRVQSVLHIALGRAAATAFSLPA